MSKPEILVAGSYPDWDMEGFRRDFTCHFWDDAKPIRSVPEALRSRIEAMAFKGHAMPQDAMDALPRLKVIANYGVGYDAIDVAAADARGIAVTNTPDVLSDEVADLAVGMLIAQARRIVEAEAWVTAGLWAREGAFPFQTRVWGRKAGIVGLGRIGREIADRLAAFKMEISYSSRSAKDTPGWRHYTDVVEMARDCDFLVVALSGGPETRGLVSREALLALGPDGIIVNISRGSTIDEEAMIEALHSGKLGAAALDVFENEPNIDPRFLKLDNVLLQPHQASATIETRAAMGALQRENLLAYFARTPLPTPVNPPGESFPAG